MNAFDDTRRAYAIFERAVVYSVHVESPELVAIAYAHSLLRQQLSAGDEDLLRSVEVLRNLRWRLATNVLPSRDSTLELEGLGEEIKHHIDQSEVGTKVRSSLEAAQGALARLMDMDQTPLGSATIELLSDSPEDERVVVLSSARNIDSTQLHLANSGVPAKVLSSHQLRFEQQLASVICIGPPAFFQPATWSAPRAESTCFVSYPLGRYVEPSGGLFGASGGLATPRFRQSGPSASSLPEEIIFMQPDELYAAAAERTASRYASNFSEGVEAALLLLEGSAAVWIAVSEGSWSWTVDFTDSEAPQIVQSQPTQILPGSFVIFREEGATSELIRGLADNRFDSARYRQAQERWKKALQVKAYELGGFGVLDVSIRKHGADASNSRGWASRNAVRPNRRDDFGSACRCLGLEAEASVIWDALSRIKVAHQRAGIHVRHLLERALVESGAHQLQAEGFQRLHLPELGSLLAYCVLHKHTKTQAVDVHLLDAPFVMEEQQWRG